MTDLRADPGRYDIREIADCEWKFYWHAFVGELRVNGGVCKDYSQGARRAVRAIACARESALREGYYWDVETCAWVKKGELPPVE